MLQNQRTLDFGKGFYTTTDFNEAAAWAKRAVHLRKTGAPFVSVYDVDENALNTRAVLHFPEPTHEWLDFVAGCRQGKNSQDWDIVYGPCVDDETIPTLIMFLDGYISADNTVARLLPQHMNNQIVFRTERALECLTFVEGQRA